MPDVDQQVRDARKRQNIHTLQTLGKWPAAAANGKKSAVLESAEELIVFLGDSCSRSPLQTPASPSGLGLWVSQTGPRKQSQSSGKLMVSLQRRMLFWTRWPIM